MNYIAYDFGVPGEVRKKFYSALEVELKKMHEDGGIGLLINNVGVANEIPKTIEEFTDQEVEDMIQCNVFSIVYMTRYLACLVVCLLVCSMCSLI